MLHPNEIKLTQDVFTRLVNEALLLENSEARVRMLKDMAKRQEFVPVVSAGNS
jgi:hypothetical protein